jgi:alkylation response protein AidB-like acyl-CoA dehydrogenase
MAHPAGPAKTPSRDHLDWPFYGDGHRALAAEIGTFIAKGGLGTIDHGDADAACKALVRKLGAAGFLRHCVPQHYGGVSPEIDSRSLCILRETLGHEDAGTGHRRDQPFGQ